MIIDSYAGSQTARSTSSKASTTASQPASSVSLNINAEDSFLFDDGFNNVDGDVYAID
jgi:hypothetical protein